MRCASCGLDAADLIAHFDGDLPPDRTQTVAARIAACAGCAQRHAGFGATRGLLRERSPLRDDPAARFAVRSQLIAEAARPGAWWRHPAVTAVALPALLLLVLIAADRVPSTWTFANRFSGCERCASGESGREGDASRRPRNVAAIALDARAFGPTSARTTVYRDWRGGTTVTVTRRQTPTTPATRGLAVREETRIVQFSPVGAADGCLTSARMVCAAGPAPLVTTPGWPPGQPIRVSTTTVSAVRWP